MLNQNQYMYIHKISLCLAVLCYAICPVCYRMEGEMLCGVLLLSWVSG